MKRQIVQNRFLEGVAAMLSEGQSVRVRIGGESMFPFIRGSKDEVELVPFQPGAPLLLWTCLFFKWGESYVVHRYVGKEGHLFCIMGDGNLFQVEKVEESDIIGVLRTIYRSDGTEQDCLDSRWLRWGALWYRLRKFRRFLLPLCRRLVD